VTLPNNIIRLGDNAYMFPSPATGITDVFIIAHGACPDGSRSFTVPDNVKVTFFAAPNQPYNPHIGPRDVIDEQINTGNATLNHELSYEETNPNYKLTNYPAGGPCTDYILGKALGNHMPNPRDQTSYLEVHAQMADHSKRGRAWIPHIVTVRSRSAIGTHTNMWLSTLIALIMAEKNDTTRIYCGNCRVEKEGMYDKWKLRRTVGKATELDSRKPPKPPRHI